jgi:hypothetical protein
LISKVSALEALSATNKNGDSSHSLSEAIENVKGSSLILFHPLHFHVLIGEVPQAERFKPWWRQCDSAPTEIAKW